MGEKLYRRDFIDKVYDKLKELNHPYSKETVYWCNRAFTDALKDVIENGDTLYVLGSFTFRPKLVKAHRINHFGTPKVLEEHYKTSFEAHRQMKEACEKLMKREKEMKEIAEDE